MSKKNLVSKITFKSVVGKPQMELVEVVDRETGISEKALRAIKKHYMRVYGSVNGSRVVATTFGDSVGFKGDFRAINLQTGEEFSGGEMFLPNTAEVFLYNFIKGLGDDFASVEFAFDVGVKAANNAVGYEYTVSPLIDQDAAKDPLARLFNSLPPLPGMAKLDAPRQIDVFVETVEEAIEEVIEEVLKDIEETKKPAKKNVHGSDIK